MLWPIGPAAVYLPQDLDGVHPSGDQALGPVNATTPSFQGDSQSLATSAFMNFKLTHI